MGNDNSKTTLENQQLIMQMQQQLLQQQQQQHNTNNYRNPREPIISPAELQRGINPYKKQQEQEQNPQSRESSSAIKLLEILGNKELMLEIDKNPSTFLWIWSFLIKINHF